MQPPRFILVGTRVRRPDVLALAQAAQDAGLDLVALAQHPPAPGSGLAAAGSRGDELAWRALPDPRAGQGMGGLVGSWVQRALRGPETLLAAQLAADPLLHRTVGAATPDGRYGQTGRSVVPDRTVGSAGTVVIGLDDVSVQALSRWRSTTAAGWTILTWDQGADRLAEGIAARRSAQTVAAAGHPPEGVPAAQAAPEHRPRAFGARHTVLVAPAPGWPVRPGVRAALERPRTTVRVVDPGEVGVPDLAGTDVLVLDGLGPAVLALPAPPGTAVVHLGRATDRSSPWRHLLPEGAVDRTLDADAVEQQPGGEDALLVAALGADVAELMRTTAAEGDEAGLALVEQHLTGGEPDLTPALIREMAFLTRVTGSSGQEERVLRRRLEQLGPGDRDAPRLVEALATIADRRQETEPGWLPEVEPAPVTDPVPGRVLHLLKVTLPQRQAGYSVRGHQSLRALVEAGVDVVAVAAPAQLPDDTPAPNAGGVTETVLDGVRYLVPDPVPGAGTAHLEQQVRALLEVVRAERPALLHVHSGGRGYDLGVVGAAVARAAALPWVYEVRGLFESLWTSDLARAERGETFDRRMAKEAELVASADAAVTLAQTMRADLAARGVEPGHVHVVPNAVDPQQLEPRPRDRALAERWGLGEAFTFGYVTNLDHTREQVEDLVRAAVILRDLGHDVRALVVGDGARRGHLEEVARRLGGQDVVVFTGRVPHDEVAATYSLLDVLVVPRGADRAARLVTPLKPYEAMAMGLPVVVSAHPALLEVIGDGERGWSYPPGDAPALARLLEQLAADPARRAAVAARGRDWVTQERTWSGNARRYVELYRSVLGTWPTG